MSTRRKRPPGRPADPEAREQRRRQILAGARKCFTEQGFHAASIADICKAAGVSVANLYQYFPSKQDLVLAIAEQDLESDFSHGPRMTGSFFERIEGLLAALADEAGKHHVASLRVEIIAESMRNADMGEAMVRMDRELTGALAGQVEKAQRRGEVTGDLDPYVVATMIHRMIDGLYVATGTGMVEPDDLIPHLVQLLRRGLEPRREGSRDR